MTYLQFPWFLPHTPSRFSLYLSLLQLHNYGGSRGWRITLLTITCLLIQDLVVVMTPSSPCIGHRAFLFTTWLSPIIVPPFFTSRWPSWTLKLSLMAAFYLLLNQNCYPKIWYKWYSDSFLLNIYWSCKHQQQSKQ